MAQLSEAEFALKVEEVVGQLGVAVAAIVTDASNQPVIRAEWQALGRGFAELMAAEQ